LILVQDERWRRG